MSKISAPMSSARRNAEALLTQSKKREASFKSEQEREYEAMGWTIIRRLNAAELAVRRFRRYLSRKPSRAHSRSSTGSVTPSLASAQSF
jgi:hypothetical protein